MSFPCFGRRPLFRRSWAPKTPRFWYRFGGPGRYYTPSGWSQAPFTPLLELSWAPLVAPGPLWVPLGTHYGASERTSRNVGEPSKLRVPAQLGTARAPLYSFGGALAPIGPPLRLFGALLKLFLGTPSALVERPRRTFGAILASLAFAPVPRSREGGAMCKPYMQAHVSEGFAKSSKTRF